VSEPSTEPSGLDDLRRRLYGPDASAEDVARYEAATARSGPALERLDRVDQAARRTGAPVLVVVAVTALVVGVAVGRVLLPAAPAAVPTRSVSAGASTGAATAAIIGADVPTPASDRAAFVSALRSGRQAGMLDSFFGDPDRLPPQLRTVQRAASTEFRGSGPGTLPLSPSALAERGGRMTVIVVLDRAGDYWWRASRAVPAAKGADVERDVAADGGGAQAGAPVAGTFHYGRGAPTSLSVVVAAGTRWGAVVVFTD
jgi:hypothetical protein